ncbi:MAG: RsmB/NOP family class I SAM-dependent RNA methyltransferase [Isosphaeraceae bacterium]
MKGRAPAPESLHVASLEVLAESTVETARLALHAVFQEQRRADRAISQALRNRRDLASPDHRFIAESVFALFRWHGWLEGLQLNRIEERLLLAWILDASVVHPVCRVWGKLLGRDASRLVALGDAPSWTARAEGLKRWGEGRGINADPWRLFPNWLREHLPLPPGEGSPKVRYLQVLDTFQKRPVLWVRSQAPDGEGLWTELKNSGLKPWVHRTVTRAARLSPDADVYHLPAFLRGSLEIQDLSSQAVGLVCDPDPGERWWDACAGAGGKSLHLATLMGGKGVVVASDTHEFRLKEAVRRARRSPFRNITTKVWDGKGKHVAGKSRSFDGVLVDAPCSAIGTWRRNPDARWSMGPEAIPRLADLQLQLLQAASHGVKQGGTLVYSVCTITPAETHEVVKRFLASSLDFALDPFTNPLNGVPTNGTLLIWPQESDSGAMFIARMVRLRVEKTAPVPASTPDGVIA